MQIKVTFPSDTPGAVLDVQKGRAILALFPNELEFVANLAALISGADLEEKPAQGNGPVVDVNFEPVV